MSAHCSGYVEGVTLQKGKDLYNKESRKHVRLPRQKACQQIVNSDPLLAPDTWLRQRHHDNIYYSTRVTPAFKMFEIEQEFRKKISEYERRLALAQVDRALVHTFANNMIGPMLYNQLHFVVDIVRSVESINDPEVEHLPIGVKLLTLLKELTKLQNDMETSVHSFRLFFEHYLDEGSSTEDEEEEGEGSGGRSNPDVDSDLIEQFPATPTPQTVANSQTSMRTDGAVDV